MRAAEVKAVGELAGQALAGTGELVRGVHAAIARRAFEATGSGGEPARVVHDGVSAAVYGGVRAALAALPRGAGALAATRTANEAPSLAATAAGALALALVNAYSGDALAAQGSALALEMTLRHRGADLDPEAVAEPSGRVAIFVHGLGETDAAWRLGATADRPWYGERLRRELGYTPLELRYNTGRRVCDNGRALAALLDELHDAWPTPIDEIAIVGHSMGGLVARSACHYGCAEGHRWTDALRHVICLGTPHLGAPLEKSIHAVSWTLDRAPETQPFARAVDRRSAGIKDLRNGACIDEDDLPPGAASYFIAAAIRRGPLGGLVGDLLVRVRSASGSGRRRRVAFADGRCLHGLTHFDLLNHPAVYDEIRAWLAR
jgi:pimeloyl-ACP methyl ester carboxylesterase